MPLNRTNSRISETVNEFPVNDTFSYVDQTGNLTSSEFLTNNQTVNDDSISFRKVVDQPIAGYRIITDPNESTDYTVRYVESETGQVYDYIPSLSETNRLTITTLPRITKATWLSDTEVLLQYDQDGRSVNYLATVDVSSAELTGQIFPSNLTSIVGVREKGVDLAYYLTRNISGGSNLYRYNFADNKSTFLQQFDISELELVSNLENGLVTLYATSKVNSANPRQAVLKLTNSRQGYAVITTTNAAQAGVVLADNFKLLTGFGTQSYIRNNVNGEEVAVNGRLLGSKCTGDVTLDDPSFVCAASILTSSQSRNWPFNWFMGQVSPTQELVRIDANFGDNVVLLEAGNNLDMVKLQTTTEYVYFIDRNTDELYEVFKGIGI